MSCLADRARAAVINNLLQWDDRMPTATGNRFSGFPDLSACPEFGPETAEAVRCSQGHATTPLKRGC